MRNDYGRCNNCQISLPTREEARAHMSDTMPVGGGSSHSVRVFNPTPDERARSAVARIVDDAIEDALEKVDRLIGREGHSKDHVLSALSGYPDFADAWDEGWS